MALPKEALDLIKSFEGYLKPLNDGTGRVRPYLCPAGVPTIGWGNTRYPDGRRVKMSDPPIDRETASRYFESELVEDETAVDKTVPGVVWHPLMRGACISFAYNCGSGAFKASGLRRAIADKRWNDVPREFRKWRVGGGRVLPGLVRRREAEIVLFMAGLSRMKNGEPAAVPVTQSPREQVIPPPSTGGPSVFTRALKWLFKR